MNEDICAALFVATPPPAEGPAARRAGVAWWGAHDGPADCDCCGERRDCRRGYNGGQVTQIRFCGPCAAPLHAGCTP